MKPMLLCQRWESRTLMVYLATDAKIQPMLQCQRWESHILYTLMESNPYCCVRERIFTSCTFQWVYRCWVELRFTRFQYRDGDITTVGVDVGWSFVSLDFNTEMGISVTLQWVCGCWVELSLGGASLY